LSSKLIELCPYRGFYLIYFDLLSDGLWYRRTGVYTAKIKPEDHPKRYIAIVRTCPDPVKPRDSYAIIDPDRRDYDPFTIPFDETREQHIIKVHHDNHVIGHLKFNPEIF
jgi:hypothetical protein